MPERLSARLYFLFFLFFVFFFVFFWFFRVSPKKAPNNSHEGEIKGGDLPELVCFFGFPRFVLLLFVFFCFFNHFTVLQKRSPMAAPSVI